MGKETQRNNAGNRIKPASRERSGRAVDSNSNTAGSTISRRAAIALGTGLVLNSSRASGDDTIVQTVVARAERRKSYRTQIKDRAGRDYRESVRPFGGQLANRIENITECDHVPHFDVIVVGSGYGGAICAARLSEKLRPGKTLAIFERGKEWLPGSFPDTFPQVSEQTRQVLLGPRRGKIVNHLGMFNVLTNDEINVLSANALGGTSLINANIVIRPERFVFENSSWPATLQDPGALEPYFKLVERELGTMPTPFDQTPKVLKQRLAAARLSSTACFFERSPQAVMYDGRLLDSTSRNRHNMIQRCCTLCGDCSTGCNVGAKNTLVYNYLPRARHHGAQIYTQVEVHRLEKDPLGWRLSVTYRNDENGNQCNKRFSVTAGVVVLGAGSPASTEILLRSRSGQLRFSNALGQRWSGNGDMIGFSIKGTEGTNIGGYGAYPTRQPGVGPTVQTSIYDRNHQDPNLDLLIQEGAIPRALTGMFSLLLQDRKLNRSMMMLGMGHDGGQGRVGVNENGPTISWPGHKEGDYRKRVRHRFAQLAQAHGGQFKYLKAFGDNLVTVHPLGSCNMSDDPDCGAVNHRGQVYDFANCSDNNVGLHQGLFVADGSIIPTSLAANPLLTIGALAERISHQLWSDPDYHWLFQA